MTKEVNDNATEADCGFHATVLKMKWSSDGGWASMDGVSTKSSTPFHFRARLLDPASRLHQIHATPTDSSPKQHIEFPNMSNQPASKIYLRPHYEPGRKHAARTYIIYFITGNPGLIEYYRTFLTHLYGLLTRNTASNRDVEFQVYGRSLSGFEMNNHEINTMKWHKIPPYGLQDQIRHAEDELADLVEDVSDDGQRDVRVIVMGHSVGSYIALEIIRRLRAHGMAGEDYATRIIGGIGLFPTVMEIVRSESGQKAAVSALLRPDHVFLLTIHSHS